MKRYWMRQELFDAAFREDLIRTKIGTILWRWNKEARFDDPAGHTIIYPAERLEILKVFGQLRKPEQRTREFGVSVLEWLTQQRKQHRKERRSWCHSNLASWCGEYIKCLERRDAERTNQRKRINAKKVKSAVERFKAWSESNQPQKGETLNPGGEIKEFLTRMLPTDEQREEYRKIAGNTPKTIEPKKIEVGVDEELVDKEITPEIVRFNKINEVDLEEVPTPKNEEASEDYRLNPNLDPNEVVWGREAGNNALYPLPRKFWIAQDKVKHPEKYPEPKKEEQKKTEKPENRMPGQKKFRPKGSDWFDNPKPPTDLNCREILSDDKKEKKDE